VLSGLPAGWNQQDIGTVGLAGTTTFSGSAITLQGSGADIWETADGCHFLSQGISGDFVITVRLASMSNTDYWAKAGLMVRETNAAGSKNVSLLVTPESGGTRMQWRISGDGDTSDHRLSLSNAPRWLRILRSGNTFIGWQSEDGATWTDQHTVTFPMNAAVQVGLAVTSHKNDTLNTATFQNVDIIALPSGTSSWSSFQNHWFTAQQIADVNLSSPSADANRDGFANLFSYGSGLSPLTSMSGISNPYPVILDSGGFLSITFPRLKNRLDYDFVVEVSSDLVTWNSGPVYTLETSVTPLDATREQVTVRDLTSMNASSRRFIRLKAIYGF
jgi:regulation of enolase protein 1 (concanavalin A-like superfamily)